MADNQAAIEHFRNHMSRVYKQHPIDELDFLYLCKEAVDLVKLEWQDRAMIADRITQIWLEHDEELSNTGGTIGGLFANLELPDGHIDTQGSTVHELWTKLDYDVMAAIHNLEVQPKKR